jgi:LppP/LprE lipoprotein
MRHRPISALLLPCATACLLTGCGGGGGKDASTSNRPSTGNAAAGRTTTTSSSERTATSTAPSPSSNTELTSTATATVTSTRTSAGPAFTQQESGEKALASAIATVKSEGYTPTDASQYRPSQTLRVLTATRASADGRYEQRAFFFVDDRYIGTDASQPSAALKIVSQGEATVTLGYGMYRSGDHLCCPSGGEATVRFQLDNGRLQALDPIPPAHSSSGLARL